MSVYTNGLAFWKHFEKVEKQLLTSLQNENYEEFRDLVAVLDDEVMEISGSHFFIEPFFDLLEMTFDTGPNKTTQYICNYLKSIAPASIKSRWQINACLPPMSEKAIEALVQIKNEQYSLADFHVFYSIENNLFDCKVYCPGFSLINNPENKKEMSMYLLELAIGELFYEAYMGRVDFIDVPDDQMKHSTMMDFYEVVLDEAEKNNWTMYQNVIDIYSVYRPIQDFAHDALRKDMKMIFTTHPLLVEQTIEDKQEVLEDLRVKDGEFGYIYYANPFHQKEDAIFRQKLSKQLNDALSQSYCANVVGGAIGKSFSYIDVIVYDCDRFDACFKEIKKQLEDVELYYQTF